VSTLAKKRAINKMKVFEDINNFKPFRSKCKGSVGLVPTLGGLHKGHISLIKKSIADNETTVVSVFLNPAQFNNKNDLKNYPSTWEEDFKILSDLQVDAVLKPDTESMYPDGYSYKVIENNISKELCGLARPGHFEGVLTVVLKLLNIVRANKAYFGEKDYQQLKLIQSLTHAFFIDTQIIACPIVRDDIINNGFKLDYLQKKWGRIFVAAFLGDVRLIDNVKA